MAKQIKVREDNYFAVQGWMVTELKLKGNPYVLSLVAVSVWNTLNDPTTKGLGDSARAKSYTAPQ